MLAAPQQQRSPSEADGAAPGSPPKLPSVDMDPPAAVQPLAPVEPPHAAEDVEGAHAAEVDALVADVAALELAPTAPVHVVLTSLSAVADPGDEGTNARYTALIEMIGWDAPPAAARRRPLPTRPHRPMLERRAAVAPAMRLERREGLSERLATDDELKADGVHTEAYLAAMAARTAEAAEAGESVRINESAACTA